MRLSPPILMALALGAAVAAAVLLLPGGAVAPPSPARAREPFPGERHFRALRQLTFSGQNAEAYWSWDERRLVFQSTRDGLRADQIFVMNDDGSGVRMVSTGRGRTTCAFFLPGDERIVFSSTHWDADEPPIVPREAYAGGYVWGVWAAYEVFSVRLDGTDLRRLTHSHGYDAEAVVSPKGDRILFTSSRDGDLDLYTMALDGSDVRRLTARPGYDGGAFYSWDGAKIVWRSSWQEGADVEAERELLRRELMRPTRLEIWVMDADGSNPRPVTSNGAANFGPFWHPDGRRVIFSTNAFDPARRNFELALVDTETGEVERVTWFERVREETGRPDDFDGFPMFTRDGRRLVFASNRFNERPNDTNVFVADWVDPPAEGG